MLQAGNGGPSRQAARPRSSTRARILRTSLDLFAQRGFDGTDIVDIEEAVGLTPGSGGFYRHFRNKEDVLHSALETEIARVQEHYRTLQKRPPSDAPDAAIADRVNVMLEMLWEMRHLMAVIAHDNTRFPELVPQIAVAMADSGVAIDLAALEQAMDDGAIPRRPAHVVATIMMMAGVGYTLADMLFGRPVADIDRAEFGTVLTALVVGSPSK